MASRRTSPVTDLFGAEGRRLLARLDVLEHQISEINGQLRERHADHPYIPLLRSGPGVGWVLAFTIAAEIGAIERCTSPEKLTGYTGLCPR